MSRLTSAGILLGTGLTILAVAGWWYKAAQSSYEDGITDWRGRSEVTIEMREEGFVPERLRIDRGTHVTFVTTRDRQFWPASNPHPSHSFYHGFDPREPIESDSSWSFAMEQPGVWGYHDHIRSYYAGTLYVE
jgi:plastocyanin